MADSLNYASPGTVQQSQLPRIGGLLGTVATFIGTGIFVLGCFGFGAAFYLSPLPMLMGVIGLILTLTAWCGKPVAGEDTHVVGSILVNIAVIVGALLEIMIMMNKSFFAGASGM